MVRTDELRDDFGSLLHILHIVLLNTTVPRFRRIRQELIDHECGHSHLKVALGARLQLYFVIITGIPLHHPEVQNRGRPDSFIRQRHHGETLLVGHRGRVPVELALMVKSESLLIKISALERVLLLVAKIREADGF